MRTKEIDVITSVANRIAHFEQKHVSDATNATVNTNLVMNNNQKNKNQRLTPSSFSQRYLDLDDIMEEESSIEDDCDNNDSDGYLAASNEETSSPDTSFRLSGRSSSSASEHSVSINQGSSHGSPPDHHHHTTSGSGNQKTNISEKLSQKSLDSGFSDYSDSKDTTGSDDKVSNEKARRMKSSVVHETHATKDSKLHHVSKVYFYSVSDLLQDNSTQFEDHLSLVKNESSSSGQSNPNTPRISSSVCDEDFFDRVESPFIPITSPSQSSSRDSPFQRCTRVHTGTSSLRRKTTSKEEEVKSPSYLYSCESPSQSPVRKSLTPSQSPFPITNGSLYSDLSLNRRNKESQNRKSKCDSSNSSTDADNQSLVSPFPSLNCSIPLENYGLNVSIYRWVWHRTFIKLHQMLNLMS